MAIEDIKNELEQRFAEPLEEFYKRRIIFWNDEDGDFKDEINDLELSNAKVLILSSDNQFEFKRTLSSLDLESNYLVYNPIISDPEHDWFLDIKLYSDEYRADKTSRLMQDLHILNTPELRKEVQRFKGFFNAVSRCKVFASLGQNIDKKSSLYMTLLTAICGIKEVKPEEIIKAVIADGPDISNSIKIELLKYNASDLFWSLVSRITGFNSSENIDELVNHIILSAISRTTSENVLSGLESKYSSTYSGFCYDLVFNWIHGEDKDSFKVVADYVTNNLDLLNRFNRFEINEMQNTDTLYIIDEVILSKLMHQIINNSIDTDSILSIVEKRRTSVLTILLILIQYYR